VPYIWWPQQEGVCCKLVPWENNTLSPLNTHARTLAVLCHHSPDRSSHSTTSLYWSATLIYALAPLWTMSSLPSRHPHITFCFCQHLLRRAKPPKPCHWLICNRHIYHVCMSRASWPYVPSLLRQAVEWVETETMEILNGDRVPLADNKVPLWKMY